MTYQIDQLTKYRNFFAFASVILSILLIIFVVTFYVDRSRVNFNPQPKKVVTVVVLVFPPKDMTINIDRELFKSIAETALRNDGYKVVDSDSISFKTGSPVVVFITINCLKYDDVTFVYSSEVGGTIPRGVNRFIKDSWVTVYDNSTIGYAGINSDYMGAMRRRLEDELIKLINKFHTSVTWSD